MTCFSPYLCCSSCRQAAKPVPRRAIWNSPATVRSMMVDPVRLFSRRPASKTAAQAGHSSCICTAGGGQRRRGMQYPKRSRCQCTPCTAGLASILTHRYVGKSQHRHKGTFTLHPRPTRMQLLPRTPPPPRCSGPRSRWRSSAPAAHPASLQRRAQMLRRGCARRSYRPLG
jgi:hypothetical protein